MPRDAQVVQPFKPFHDHFATLGFAQRGKPTRPVRTIIVFLPRAKALARAIGASGLRPRQRSVVVVDGAKTDGVDSLLKDIRKRVAD